MADINQALGDRSPGSAMFSFQASSASEVYYVAGSDLQSAITQILGSCEAAGDGGLNRKLPASHPHYPFLYASSVRATGLGVTDPDDAAEGGVQVASDELEAPPISETYWRYARYALTVDYTQRPYAVLANDSVKPTNTISYYNTTNTLISNVTTAPEWFRWTDLEYNPAPEIAFAQQGNQLFYVGTTNTAPGGKSFSGFPRIYIPKATVVVTWYEVPFQYIISFQSKLVEYVGRINQNPWWGWSAGALVYLGAKVIRRYTPPFPKKTAGVTGSTTFSTSKLMDVSLTFEETVRTVINPPTYGAGNTSTTVANRSYVLGGHNAFPFFGGTVNTNGVVTVVNRGFYYAGTPDNNKTPTFDSCEMSLLFTDPDVT